jgi:hypothetical protein
MSDDQRIAIPTYDDTREDPADWSRPHDLVLRESTAGLRVILGDPDDPNAPDLLIERTPDRWRVIVHPDASDPLCVIEFTEKAATIIPDEPGRGDEPLLTQSRGVREQA